VLGVALGAWEALEWIFVILAVVALLVFVLVSFWIKVFVR
jgi:hypothetical protein